MALKTLLGSYLGLMVVSLSGFLQEGLGRASLHYRVEAPAANSGNVLVQVEGTDFPPLPLLCKLPPSCLGKRPMVRILDLVVKQGDEEPSPLMANSSGAFQIDVPANGSFSLSFSFVPRAIANQWEYSFREGRLALLIARDFTFSLADEVASSVEFKLPEGWEILPAANSASQKGIELRPEAKQYFLITSYQTEKINWSRINFTCIYRDAPNERTSLCITELKKQCRYVQEAERIRKNRNFLILFNGLAAPHFSEVFSPLPNMLVFPSVESDEADYFKRLESKRVLALELSRIFFPALGLEDKPSPEVGNLLTYLSWKILLKCGEISQEDFLEFMTQGILPSSKLKNSIMSSQSSHETSARDQIPLIQLEGVSRYFLMDLWLECFGRQNRNAAELLGKIKEADASLLGKSVPWAELFRKERRAGRYAELLFEETPVPLKDLLQPFGLIYFQRILPFFAFQLSESCEVVKLENVKPRGVKLGDRILMVDETQLHSPFELLKLKSSYEPGQTVTLTVERNGIILKVPYRLASKSYSRLELNRLADSDKLAKVEQFFAKTIVEP